MQPSAELRWFFAGRIPSPVSQWFGAAQSLAPEQRTDEYLLIPSPGVGVKFRQGNFEIKALVEDCGVCAWGRVSGRVQTWVKWSCRGDEIAPLRLRVLEDGSPVMAVGKRRSLRKFSLDRGLREVPAEDRPADGCNMELTALGAGEQDYWSFGFESFGYAHPERIRDFLSATVEHAFGSGGGPAVAGQLSAANSLSYPEWLRTLPR